MTVTVMSNGATDPDQREWGVFVDGRITSPRWRDEGPAQAYAEAIRAGTRQPEFTTHAAGGTTIENPHRERIMLTTWRSAIHLERHGIQVRRGKKVSTLAKAHFGMKRNALIADILHQIEARLTELGYAPRN